MSRDDAAPPEAGDAGASRAARAPALAASADLLAVPPGFVLGATGDRLRDALDYFAPDALVLAGTDPDPRAMHVLDHRLPDDVDTFAPGLQHGVSVDNVDDVQVVTVSAPADLGALRSHEGDRLDPGTETYVLSDLLSLDTSLTTLETTLDGRDAYVDALAPDALNGSYTHLSTGLPSDYYHDWDDLVVHGVGADRDRPGAPLPCLTLRGDGTVSVRTLDPGKLGLRALAGVGETTARRLRDAGYTSRSAVADASRTDLAAVHGIGAASAETISTSARAMAAGEVVRTGGDDLPSREPIHIDIETDGLNPTIVWLVGAYDPTTDTYTDFVQRDPSDPGGALTEFMAWYLAEGDGRPLCAYNGWNFDFEVIEAHLAEHAPAFLDDWRSTHRFDPYAWSVRDGNAVLPGHTNTLADVTDALGYDGLDTGLSGKTVARKYRQWLYDQRPGTELDWDRHRRYCEDDTRRLAALYDALRDADRIVATEASEETESVQGALSDFS